MCVVWVCVCVWCMFKRFKLFSTAMTVHCSCSGVYGVLVGKPEGKRLLGRPRHRWEDNIKMALEEVGWTGSMWLRIRTGDGHV